MRKTIQRWLTICLVVVICLGVLPAMAAGATDGSYEELRPSGMTITGCGGAYYPLDNIIDNNLSTTWACTPTDHSEGEPHWFVVDFGETVALKKYVLYHQGAFNSSQSNMNTVDFTVSVSADGNTYETVQTVTGNTANETELCFDKVKNVQYVRVYITDSNPEKDTVGRMAEMRFFTGTDDPEPDPQPILYLDMEDVSDNQVTNQVNGKQYTVNGDAATLTKSVNGSNALVFNGSTNFVSLGTEDYLPKTDAMTFAAWINMDHNSNWAQILSAGKTGDEETDCLSFKINTQDHVASYNRFIMLDIKEGGQQRVLYQFGDNYAAEPYNTWHHVAFSLSSSEAKIYVDGKLFHEEVLTEFPITRYSTDLLLGSVIFHVDGNPKSDAFFKGAMDEVRLYDAVLTEEQIKGLATMTSEPEEPEPEVTPAPLQPLPMVYLDMEDVSNNQVTNKVNNQTHKVNGATATQGESVNGSKSLTFNGADNSVSLGLTEYLPENEALTFAAWIKLQPNKNWAPLVSAGPTGDAKDFLWCSINTQAVFSRFMLLEIREDNQQRMYEDNNLVSFAENPYDTWHHVAFSLSANEAKVYVDGKCVNTSELTEFPISRYATELLLGNVIGNDGTNPKSDAFFKGDMDEVCLYDVTLTDAQIKALYEQSKKTTEFVKVQLNYNDGTDKVDVMYAEKGRPMIAPNTVFTETPGLEFAYWTGWNFVDPVTSEVTLTANWNNVGISTVTFDTDGGSEIAPIQVTTGRTVKRPEDPTKEGKNFVGWRLNRTLFDFTTPITENITLKAVWVDTPVDGALTIEAGQLNMVLDSYGRITSLKSKLSGEEYITAGPDELKSLLSLVADYEIKTPAGLTFNKETNEITFEFPSIDATAVVKLEVKENYTTLTLKSVEKPETVSLQAALWGPIKTKIMTGGQSVGTAYDDEFAIGLHMLNQKTIGGWPVEYPDYTTRGYNEALGTRRMDMNTAVFTTWGSALRAYSWDYTKDTYRTNGAGQSQLNPAMTGEKADRLASMIGSSVALYGTRPDNILNVISNIELTEGLPHPTINGMWQRTSLETSQDYLMFMDTMWDDKLEIIANDIQMAKDAGIEMIYFRQEPSGDGAWLGHGGYILDEHLGGSEENAKQLVAVAEENGIHLGTHTYSNLIRQDDLNGNAGWENYTKYLDEGASALAYGDSTVLTREASATDTVIYVASNMSRACDRTGQRTVRIGNEILSFSDCQKVSDTEWKLTGCSRGNKTTTAAVHTAGESAYMLWTYHLGYHVGGWDSIDAMTADMAAAYANTGMKSTSFDSFESNAFGIYGTLAPTEFAYRFYEQMKELNPDLLDGFLADNSRMTSNVWDIQPRVGWGESGGSVTEMNKNFDYYKMNFTTVMLGWTYQSGTPNRHGGYGKDELLSTLALKASANAGTQWMVDQDTFEKYPHMPEMLKTWNNAIAHGAFVVGEDYTAELQAAMRVSWSQWPNNRIWTLTETVEDQEWVLQEVQRDSDLQVKIGDPVTLHATKDITVVQPEDFDIATSVSREYFRAHTGDEVTVYAVPHTGKEDKVEKPVVLDKDGKSIALTPVEGDQNAWTFIMPDSDVTIALGATGPIDPAEELTVTLDKSALTLEKDAAAELKATVTPADAVLTWTTSDETVATVANGTITAVGEGTATITVTAAYEGKTVSTTCTVTVTKTENPVDIDVKPGSKPDTKPEGTTPFRDVSENDWYFDAVKYVYENGLMNGTSADMFSPNSQTTRGMIVTILYRQSGSPKVTSDKATWWSDARVWAMENDVSDGTSMDGNITREQLAAMLYRYAKLTGADTSARGNLNKFTDSAVVSDWATEAVQWAVGEGIIGGRPDGTLDPKGLATRAEVAAMFMRFCEKVA